MVHLDRYKELLKIDYDELILAHVQVGDIVEYADKIYKVKGSHWASSPYDYGAEENPKANTPQLLPIDPKLSVADSYTLYLDERGTGKRFYFTGDYRKPTLVAYLDVKDAY